jgi:serine/threonine protein kinase
MKDAGTITADSMVGTTLAGRYRVEARVGSGAMGAVYRAEQAILGRHVALKIVNRDRHVGGDTVQRFRREAKALSALNHPNTVRVFDFGSTDEGLLFLAMELLEGEPLTDCMVREGPLPVLQAVSIIQQVLRSISEAHAQGIVHRDLKPDNVFLARVPSDPVPMVKVLDFGIAKAVDGDRRIDQFETLDGTVFGTPRYMSPEQAAGKTLDPRSDLYSVGIMLYELLTGNPPFVDMDAVVVMARHIREEPVPLCKAAPQRPIPACLEAVMTKTLSKQPAERFQTAEQFERALEQCLPEISRLARLSWKRLQPGFSLPRWLATRSSSAWAAAVVVGLLAIGGVGLAFNRQAPATSDTSTETAAATTTSLEPMPTPPTNLGNTLPPTAAELAGDDRVRPRTARVVQVETAPAAAAVLQDGSELGVTPLDVSMNPGSTLTLLLKKKGFAEHRLELRADDHKRVVTLRRLDERPGSGNRRQRERVRRPSTSASQTNAPTTPTATASPAPSGNDQSSPYEKF